MLRYERKKKLIVIYCILGIYICNRITVCTLIYAYVLEVHMIIAFNVLSDFLDSKVTQSGIRKFYDGLT